MSCRDGGAATRVGSASPSPSLLAGAFESSCLSRGPPPFTLAPAHTRLFSRALGDTHTHTRAPPSSVSVPPVLLSLLYFVLLLTLVALSVMLRACRCWHTIFDACYVLNLDRRPDRWAHVQQQVKRARLHKFLKPGVEVTRLSGIDGNGLDVAGLHRDGVLTDQGYQRYQLPTEQKLYGMDLTKGAIGCALSHRAVWQRVVAEHRACALILEDDLEFHHQFSRQFAERWSRVPADWGIVHMGGLDLLASGKPPRPYIADGIRLAYHGHRELTAYVVHAASAQRCLDLSLPMTWQVDTHISSCLADDAAAQDKYIADPKMYVFQPSLVIQLMSFTTDVQKKPTDNPALADAARRLREFVGGGTSVR